MSASDVKERLLTARETREILHVSDTTLWRMVNRGQIPQPIRIGQRRYWRKATIEAMIEKWEKEASA